MSALLTVLTIAGGHLIEGRRLRAYAYLAALVLLPVLSWIAQGVWVVSVSDRTAQAPVVASIVFWITLTLIWLSSIGLVVLDRLGAPTEPKGSRYSLPALETAMVSIASIVVIGFSVLSVGVVPFLSQERGFKGPVAGVRGKELPHDEGSVQFVGTVIVKGAVAGNRQLVFLFDHGFVSRGIDTDPTGKFAYTLPPGRWTLLAPYLPGFPGNLRFDLDPPVQNRELSFDVSTGPVIQTYTIVVHAD
jgi:hypothetical protein